MILVLIPSRHEAADFLRRLENPRRTAGAGGLRLVAGRLHGRDVVVAETGMGAKVAARRTAAALDALPRPAAVWLAGYGGGLDPALKRGDIAVLERTPGALPADAALPAHRRVPSIRTAAVVVATPEDKARLFRETGAAVVEMEADAVFGLTDARSLPSAAVRVVSDAADEALPADLLACGYDMDKGRETPLRMVARLISHPGDILRLKAFLAPLPAIRKTLADFLEAAVKASPREN